MDDLFRLMTVRSAQSADPGTAIPLIGSRGTTAFQEALRPLRGPKGFDAMAARAREYERSPQFADPPSSLALAAQLGSFKDQLAGIMTGCTTQPTTQPDRRGESGRSIPEEPKTDGTTLTALEQAVRKIFGQKSTDLVASSGFKSDMERVHDSLVALFLAPPNARIAATQELAPEAEAAPAAEPLSKKISLEPLAAIARLLALLVRVAGADATLNQPGAIARALQRMLLLPPTIFPINPEQRVLPVGVADLLVVRQHIAGYRPGEVCHVENLLAGESRKHTDKHTRTTERVLTSERETTTETSTDLKTTEKFDLKHEVENTLKEDLSVKAGLSVSAKFGKTLTVDANVNVAYKTSQEHAAKSATSYAKDVLTRAAEKVTERTLSREIWRTVETFEDQMDHAFDNSGGTRSIRGVYQWLDKVHTAQIFRYGERLLFDISIPEPAAFLLSAGKAGAETARPEAPLALTLSGKRSAREEDRPVLPADLQDLAPDHKDYKPEFDYGIYIARYGVVGVEPPPAERIVVSKAFSPADPSEQPKHNLIVQNLDALPIPDGYEAHTIQVNGTFNQKHKDHQSLIKAGGKDDNRSESITGEVWVYLGRYVFHFEQGKQVGDEKKPMADPQIPNNTLFLKDPQLANDRDEVGKLPVSLSTWNVQDVSLTIEVICERTATEMAKWQLRTYSRILETYNRLDADYRDRLAAHERFRPQTAAPASGSPEQNRNVERRELKKAAVQILANRDLVVQRMDAVNDTPPDGQTRSFPRVDLAAAQEQGRFIRFFEQAFEWEQMTYFFYPYFWGRPSTWYDKVRLQSDDPLFTDFLKAGEARVVVPVRPGFEVDIWYYLMTEQLWCGGDLPGIADTHYLSITEEIRKATSEPIAEEPVGTPWDVVIPTELVLLRDDGKLPAWKRTGDWSWSEDATRFI
jgi:hypothetical protein